MSVRYETRIDADVRAVLLQSEIDGVALRLPPGPLDRGLYARVDRVLQAAGGRWNLAQRAHLFPGDPRAVLVPALEQGAILDQRRRARQPFFTPDWLAEILAGYCDLTPGVPLLEPSAGGGALAGAARARGAVVQCVEIDAGLAEDLRADGFPVLHEDFLSVHPEGDQAAARLDPLAPSLAPFARVLMNAPFTDQQDIAHVWHAMKFVAPGGLLVAVLSADVTTSRTSAARQFRTVVRMTEGRFVDLPEQAFEESGARVRTVCLTWRPPGL